MKPQKAVIILSGGMDSTTLAYDLCDKGFELYALSFDYGQRHKKELKCAETTCDKLGISHHIVDLSSITALVSNSALTGNIDVPEGHYADDNMKLTVVPNRNMIMLSIAIGYAANIGADYVCYGAHAGDHAIYPDCRPEFVQALGKAAALCHFSPVHIYSPYMHMTKGEIARRGDKVAVPFEDTWTCYKGGEEPCGVCGSCVERAEAFEFAGIIDPLVGSHK